jgi:hypothetical protein
MLQAPESCWRRCCRDDVGQCTTSLPSHVGGGADEATWSWRVVSAESCWQWHYRGKMQMLSQIGDGAAGVTWQRHDVDVES